MNFTWPDLHFGPINLWNAPWLGRAYEEFNRKQPVPKDKPLVPNARIEQLNQLTKNR